jgi:hypothetical protein
VSILRKKDKLLMFGIESITEYFYVSNRDPGKLVWTTIVRFPAGVRNHSPLHHIQTGSGANLSLKITGASYHKSEAARM